MIGHLVKAYREGRSDARAGTFRKEALHSRKTSPSRRTLYLQGYSDERERMRALGQLPQCEIPLGIVSNALTASPEVR